MRQGQTVFRKKLTKPERDSANPVPGVVTDVLTPLPGYDDLMVVRCRVLWPSGKITTIQEKDLRVIEPPWGGDYVI